jgi:hypothetical protein
MTTEMETTNLPHTMMPHYCLFSFIASYYSISDQSQAIFASAALHRSRRLETVSRHGKLAEG